MVFPIPRCGRRRPPVNTTLFVPVPVLVPVLVILAERGAEPTRDAAKFRIDRTPGACHKRASGTGDPRRKPQGERPE